MVHATIRMLVLPKGAGKFWIYFPSLRDRGENDKNMQNRNKLERALAARSPRKSFSTQAKAIAGRRFEECKNRLKPCSLNWKNG